MKNQKVYIVAGTMLVVLTLSVASQIFLFGQDEKAFGRGRNIEGTWQTVVTRRNCDTGAPLGPAFPGLLSFHEGGTMSGTSTAVNSAYGVWNRERGRSEFSFTGLSLRYAQDGTFIGTQRINQSISVESSDGFTSTGTVQIFDTNGNQIGAGCATSVGTRFE